jgi:hypothetical protein
MVMSRALSAGLFVAACARAVVGQTENTTETTTTMTTTSNGITNVELKVLGQSGKFTLYSTYVGENDPNKVTVLMDSLIEVDAQGNAVGTTGSVSNKHSIQTFAPQEFTVADPVSSKIGDVDTQKITFSSPVGSIGEISVDTLIVLGHGIVGPASEQWEVFPGDLKWNIEFPSWKFCGDGATCKKGSTNEVGAFLDLDITVKGSAASAAKVSGNENKYSLGGGVNLLLTKKVMIDGTETEMPEGYPKMEMKGNMQVFKFRFPKFSSNATYDPVIESSKSESIPTTTTTTTIAFVGGAKEFCGPGAWTLGVASLLCLASRIAV